MVFVHECLLLLHVHCQVHCSTYLEGVLHRLADPFLAGTWTQHCISHSSLASRFLQFRCRSASCCLLSVFSILLQGIVSSRLASVYWLARMTSQFYRDQRQPQVQPLRPRFLQGHWATAHLQSLPPQGILQIKCEDLKLWRLNSRTRSGEYIMQLLH